MKNSTTMPRPIALSASTLDLMATPESLMRTYSVRKRPAAKPTNRPATGMTNIPTIPANAAMSIEALGMRCFLSLRPVSTALADQPTHANRTPMAAAVHEAVEPSIHPHAISVTMATGLPGSRG